MKIKNKTKPQVSLKSGQNHTSQRVNKTRNCKHNGGKGYWSNMIGCVCLKCGKELKVKVKFKVKEVKKWVGSIGTC